MATGLLDKIRIIPDTPDENPGEIPSDTPPEILQDFDGESDLDPVPGEPARAAGPRGKGRRAAPRTAEPAPSSTKPPVSAKVRKEVAEEVEALLEMMAMGWGLMDSECSAVLSEQSKEIAEKLTGLLVRSPRLLARMREAGLIGDWAKFAMAIGPVLKAVWSHHVARPLREEEDEGVFDPSRFAPYRPQ